MTELVPLTISAESLTAALEAVSSSGAPLLGATVQLQLHGTGFQSALTQLQVNLCLVKSIAFTSTMEAVSSSGPPLLGATVQLQLHGTGFQSAQLS